MKVSIHNADCLRILKGMPDCSVDSIVTDPPYGLSFMGKKWDYDVPAVEVWQECWRVMKPGGHLLAFAGTRTQHRMAVRIEDAGFEIRDMIAWCYGSGFPKSLDVSKAIDKAAGAERESVGTKYAGIGRQCRNGGEIVGGVADNEKKFIPITAPATEAAKQWAGWGTALKPSLEPITVARKPLCGTVAENVLQHGTGGLNVNGCRVAPTGEALRGGAKDGSSASKVHEGWDRPWRHDAEHCLQAKQRSEENQQKAEQLGRWPANLIHDGSDEVVGLLNEAARFFYCAKSSKKDRGEGNNHPTVKPTDLMRYLCRLVTPPNGIVLDPYMGSGSTGKAAVLEGFSFIGIEMNAEYYAIARTRIKSAKGVK
jgi:DNA modification methylase